MPSCLNDTGVQNDNVVALITNVIVYYVQCSVAQRQVFEVRLDQRVLSAKIPT